jgi:hypothetical protein
MKAASRIDRVETYGGIELKNQVVRVVATSHRKVQYAIESKLLDINHFFGSQVLSQLYDVLANG